MSQPMRGSTKTLLVVVAIIAIVIPIALTVVLLNGAPPLPSTTTSTTTTSSSSGGSNGATITIPTGAGSGANFTPATLTVKAGTTITFVSIDASTHNVDFTAVPSGSTVPSGTISPNMKSGNIYTVTLMTPGTYSFVCDYHSWMKGTITVTA